jgi:hypothetical protein
MKYSLWFYKMDSNGECHKTYEVFAGTRYQCYKIKKNKAFGWQFKVLKNPDKY